MRGRNRWERSSEWKLEQQREATNSSVRGSSWGKGSELRLIPVVRKETKGTWETKRERERERERERIKRRLSSEMIKLRIFLAYSDIKEDLREGEWWLPRWRQG